MKCQSSSFSHRAFLESAAEQSMFFRALEILMLKRHYSLSIFEHFNFTDGLSFAEKVAYRYNSKN